MRCLAKDPANRPQDAAELFRQLEKCRVAVPWTNARAHDWWRLNRAPEIPIENRTGAIMIQ